MALKFIFPLFCLLLGSCALFKKNENGRLGILGPHETELGKNRWLVVQNEPGSVGINKTLQLVVGRANEICDEHDMDAEVKDVLPIHVGSFFDGGQNVAQATVECVPRAAGK